MVPQIAENWNQILPSFDHFGVGRCYPLSGRNEELPGRWSVMQRESIKSRLRELQKREPTIRLFCQPIQLAPVPKYWPSWASRFRTSI